MGWNYSRSTHSSRFKEGTYSQRSYSRYFYRRDGYCTSAHAIVSTRQSYAHSTTIVVSSHQNLSILRIYLPINSKLFIMYFSSRIHLNPLGKDASPNICLPFSLGLKGDPLCVIRTPLSKKKESFLSPVIKK